MEPDRLRSLAAAFSALAAETADRNPLPLLRMAAQRVPGCTWASIITITDGRGRTLAASDPVAEAADDVQHSLESGPCMEAARVHPFHTVFSIDETSNRWPEVADGLRATPVRTVLAVHMLEDDPTSLNLYSDELDGFHHPAVAVAALIAAQAATMLSASQPATAMTRMARSLDEQRELQTAIFILMSEGDVTREEALAAVFEASRTLDEPAVGIAAYVITHGTLPT